MPENPSLEIRQLKLERSKLCKVKNDNSLFKLLASKMSSELRAKQLLFKVYCWMKSEQYQTDYRLFFIKCGGVKASSDVALSSKKNNLSCKNRFEVPSISPLDTLYLEAVKATLFNAELYQKRPTACKYQTNRRSNDHDETRIFDFVKELLWSNLSNAISENSLNVDNTNFAEDECRTSTHSQQSTNSQISETLSCGRHSSQKTENSEELPMASLHEVEDFVSAVKELDPDNNSGFSTPTSRTPTPDTTKEESDSNESCDFDEKPRIFHFEKIRTRNQGKIDDPHQSNTVPYAEQPDDTNLTLSAACGNTHCNLGCVCDSIAAKFLKEDSCGLMECIFKCTCKQVLLPSYNDLGTGPSVAFVALRPKRNVRPPSKIRDFAVVTGTLKRSYQLNSSERPLKKKRMSLLETSKRKIAAELDSTCLVKKTMATKIVDCPSRKEGSENTNINSTKSKAKSDKLLKKIAKIPLKKEVVDKLRESKTLSPQLQNWLLRRQQSDSSVIARTRKQRAQKMLAQASPFVSPLKKMPKPPTLNMKAKPRSKKFVELANSDITKKNPPSPSQKRPVVSRRPISKNKNESKRKEPSERPPRKVVKNAKKLECEFEDRIDLMLDGSDDEAESLLFNSSGLFQYTSGENYSLEKENGNSKADVSSHPKTIPEDAADSESLKSVLMKREPIEFNPHNATREDVKKCQDEESAPGTEKEVISDSFEKKYPFMARAPMNSTSDKMKCARVDSTDFLLTCAKCRPISERYFVKNEIRAEQKAFFTTWKDRNESMPVIEDSIPASISDFKSTYVYLNGNRVEIFSNCNWSPKKLKIYELVLKNMENPYVFKCKLGTYSIEIIDNVNRKGKIGDRKATAVNDFDNIRKTIVIRYHLSEMLRQTNHISNSTEQQSNSKNASVKREPNLDATSAELRTKHEAMDVSKNSRLGRGSTEVKCRETRLSETSFEVKSISKQQNDSQCVSVNEEEVKRPRKLIVLSKKEANTSNSQQPQTNSPEPVIGPPEKPDNQDYSRVFDHASYTFGHENGSITSNAEKSQLRSVDRIFVVSGKPNILAAHSESQKQTNPNCVPNRQAKRTTNELVASSSCSSANASTDKPGKNKVMRSHIAKAISLKWLEEKEGKAKQQQLEQRNRDLFSKLNNNALRRPVVTSRYGLVQNSECPMEISYNTGRHSNCSVIGPGLTNEIRSQPVALVTTYSANQNPQNADAKVQLMNLISGNLKKVNGVKNSSTNL